MLQRDFLLWDFLPQDLMALGDSRTSCFSRISSRELDDLGGSFPLSYSMTSPPTPILMSSPFLIPNNGAVICTNTGGRNQTWHLLHLLHMASLLSARPPALLTLCVPLVLHSHPWSEMWQTNHPSSPFWLHHSPPHHSGYIYGICRLVRCCSKIGKSAHHWQKYLTSDERGISSTSGRISTLLQSQVRFGCPLLKVFKQMLNGHLSRKL